MLKKGIFSPFESLKSIFLSHTNVKSFKAFLAESPSFNGRFA